MKMSHEVSWSQGAVTVRYLYLDEYATLFPQNVFNLISLPLTEMLLKSKAFLHPWHYTLHNIRETEACTCFSKKKINNLHLQISPVSWPEAFNLKKLWSWDFSLWTRRCYLVICYKQYQAHHTRIYAYVFSNSTLEHLKPEDWLIKLIISGVIYSTSAPHFPKARSASGFFSMSQSCGKMFPSVV